MEYHRVVPESPRTLAGFVSADRLSVGFYGEIYRAHGPGGRPEYRMLVIEPALAADLVFREALLELATTRHGPALRQLAHPSLAATRSVGVADDGSLVVVTDMVNGPIAIHNVFDDARRAGGKLPAEIAAAVATSVVAALSAAHSSGVVHGALHPRSVLIDFDGTVKVVDFAVGRALATSKARGAEAALAKGLSGFLAPELALGDDPGPACDVYAVGALMFLLRSGEMPPGTSPTTPAI